MQRKADRDTPVLYYIYIYGHFLVPQLEEIWKGLYIYDESCVESKKGAKLLQVNNTAKATPH